MNEEEQNTNELANSVPASDASNLDHNQDQLRKDVLKQEQDEDQESITADLSSLSLEELFQKAQDALVQSPKVALKWLNNIRPVFFDKFHEEKKVALEAFKEKNEDPSHFVFEKETLADKLNELVVQAKDARSEEKKRIEDEKRKNLARKEALLEILTSLVQTDETEESIQQVKEIQKEWKNIRVLPKDSIQPLWEKYHFLLDKFYDNHSINIELKELDRKKNLELKIELTKKVDELAAENSLKKSFIMLNKYHEEFKNIGPVPKESREGIWQAFKAASDKIYDLKRGEFEDIQEKRKENMALKELVLEKLSLIAQVQYQSMKDWNQKTKEVEDLFQEWRKIGPVPKTESDIIWSKFKAERNTFYNQRKAYFKEDQKRRKANLLLKEDLCKRVEAIKDNENLAETTKEILTIQKEWKSIGPVPDKINQAIWSRFRAACDHFFSRKEEAFSSRKQEEEENLKQKTQLIEDLNSLIDSDEGEESSFEKFKEINENWNKLGYVPRKNVKSLSKSYEGASKALFKKFNKNRDGLKAAQLTEHYEHIAHTPNGIQRLNSEEHKIRKRLSFLNEEILNLERNMSFFAKSKTADQLLKDFEIKLKNTKSQVERLNSELHTIRATKRKERSKEAAENSDS